MALSPEDKKRIMEERAKAFFQDSSQFEETTIENDITDIVTTNIGGGSVSEKLIQELLASIEHRYGGGE